MWISWVVVTNKEEGQSFWGLSQKGVSSHHDFEAKLEAFLGK